MWLAILESHSARDKKAAEALAIFQSGVELFQTMASCMSGSGKRTSFRERWLGAYKTCVELDPAQSRSCRETAQAGRNQVNLALLKVILVFNREIYFGPIQFPAGPYDTKPIRHAGARVSLLCPFVRVA
jgi:hypothetical protein